MTTFAAALHFTTLQLAVPTIRRGSNEEVTPVHHIGDYAYMTSVEDDGERVYINHHVYHLGKNEFVTLRGVNGYSPNAVVPFEVFQKAVDDV